MQNRINNSPDEIIINACVRFYSDNEIENAKQELYKLLESSNSSEVRRVLTRRKDVKKSVEDIVSSLKACDMAKEVPGIFVSKNLHKIPHDDEGNASINGLLAALLKMERQMNEIASNYVTKSDLDKQLDKLSSKTNTGVSRDKSPLPFFENLKNTPPKRKSETGANPIQPKTASNASSQPSFSSVLLHPSPKASAQRSWSNEVGTASRSAHANNTRKPVAAKKKTEIVIGKSVSAGALSFKGADLTIHRFIGNVHPDVNVETMKKDLDQMGITVLDLQLNQGKSTRMKSFHLTAKRSDSEKIDDPETWPENIVVRRFFLPRKKPEATHAGDQPRET